MRSRSDGTGAPHPPQPPLPSTTTVSRTPASAATARRSATIAATVPGTRDGSRSTVARKQSRQLPSHRRPGRERCPSRGPTHHSPRTRAGSGDTRRRLPDLPARRWGKRRGVHAEAAQHVLDRHARWWSSRGGHEYPRSTTRSHREAAALCRIARCRSVKGSFSPHPESLGQEGDDLVPGLHGGVTVLVDEVCRDDAVGAADDVTEEGRRVRVRRLGF